MLSGETQSRALISMNKDSEGTNAQTARQTVDRSGRITSVPNGSNARLTIGAILASAAVLVAIAQAVLGVRIVGDHESHDGGFAVVTFDLFRRAIAAGDLPSRWLMGGNCGFGSPVLYFYPPGAFLAAELVGFILPGADADTVLGFTGIIFRVASVATCTLWLRRRCHIATALAAGGLYALLPYISIVNPQIRMAFAESAGAALLPLGFLALDVADGCFRRTLAVGAPAFAALALTHLPMTVLAGGLLSVYGGLKGMGWLDRLRRVCTTATMVLLGLGLAGITVVPAISLLPEISSSQLLSVPGMRPENNFLLDMRTMFRGQVKMELMLHANLAFAVVVAAAGLWTIVRRGLRPRIEVVGTLFLAVLLVLPVSTPLWTLPAPLRQVQFPWRLFLPISLLASACAAFALEQSKCRMMQRSLFAVGLLFAVTGMAVAVKWGDRGRLGALRVEDALTSTWSYPLEYIPAAAARASWLPFRDGRWAEEVLGAAQNRSGARVAIIPDARGLHVDLDGRNGALVLPQFWFPGWVAKADGVAASSGVDPTTGLLRVEVPSGTKIVSLHRVVLASEWWGLGVSLAATVLWAVAVFAIFRNRARVRGSQELSVDSLLEPRDRPGPQ